MNQNKDNRFFFSDVYKALAYYRFKNPARAKYINLLERDGRGNSYAEEFSGDHPNDIYASVVNAIQKAMFEYPIDWQKAFSMCDLAENRAHPMEAAKELGYTEKMIQTMRTRIKDDLISELKRRELLDYND